MHTHMGSLNIGLNIHERGRPLIVVALALIVFVMNERTTMHQVSNRSKVRVLRGTADATAEFDRRFEKITRTQVSKVEENGSGGVSSREQREQQRQQRRGNGSIRM